MFNIAVACNYLGRFNPQFFRKGMQFAGLVIEMRYAKADTLMKAMRSKCGSPWPDIAHDQP